MQNQIHLWFARDEEITDDRLLSEYHALLSDEESQQWQRFYFEKHRHQYLITRALVRAVFSLYVNEIPPDAWRFGRTEYNKPYIQNRPLPFNLQFNLSHTKRMIVLAVTADDDIGVDVECCTRRNAGLELAQKYFSQVELRDLHALRPARQKARFFDLWTLKEAYIKARGMGLTIPLNHFNYRFPEPGTVQMSFESPLNDQPQRWSLWQIKPSETHIVGLAVRRCHSAVPCRISMREIVPLQSIKEVNHPVVARS